MVKGGGRAGIGAKVRLRDFAIPELGRAAPYGVEDLAQTGSALVSTTRPPPGLLKHQQELAWKVADWLEDDLQPRRRHDRKEGVESPRPDRRPSVPTRDQVPNQEMAQINLSSAVNGTM